MPLKWLGGKELCFTLEPVEPGDVNEDSILHIEPRARNKEDIVGKGLKAVKRIEEDSKSWNYDTEATDWAVNLVNTDASMRGSNVECTAVGDLSTLIYDPSENKLLTRPQSRGVVATIFERMSSKGAETVTAITGLPGIGKSWTLLYVLQQALLYEGVFVIFITDGLTFYLFHRRSGKIYAWSTNIKNDGSQFLDSKETLFIYDPSPKKEFELPIGTRRLIYAASIDKNFDKREMKKDPSMLHFVGPWTENELRAAFTDFEKDEGLRMSDILERVNCVGGLPRYLMRKASFETRLKQITTSVQQLDSDKDSGKIMLDASKELSIFSHTISGSLYSVFPKMNKDFECVDYEGKCFLYQKRVVKWASQRVYELVLMKFRK